MEDLGMELVRRDPAWKVALGLAAGALLAFLLMPLAGDQGSTVMVLFGGAYLATMRMVKPHQRASLFEASLPVTARDLYVGRSVAMLAMVWLPVLTAEAVLSFRGTWGPAAALLCTGAVMSVAVALSLSFDVPELGARQWKASAVWVATIAALAPLLTLGPIPLLEVAGAAAGLAVWRIVAAWRSIPPSYETAPERAVAARRGASSEFSWVWRLATRLAWPAAGFVPMQYLTASMGIPFAAAMFGIFTLSSVRESTQWVRTLPVSARMLTAATVLPIMAALLATVTVGIKAPGFFGSGIGHLGLNLIAVATVFLIGCCVMGWNAWAVWILMAPLLLAPVTSNPLSLRDRWTWVLLHVVDRAPWGVWAAVLVGLYLVVEAQSARSEVVGAPKEG